MTQKVLSFDLGGTKVSAGIVGSDGKVVEEIRVPALISRGKAALVQQLATLGQDLMTRHKGVRKVGIASAGPLDPRTGVLLDPTNFSTNGQSWGKFPLAQLLQKKLKKPVFLENDAAAAMLAEHWIGAAKKYDNAMILTLGTGLGTGIFANGEQVRAGRFLHPEAGHLILNAGDESAPCGCGRLGCAEAYLSGRNFERRARERLGNSELTAKEVADLARQGDTRAQELFEEYARMMAVAIHNYAVIYCPEVVILTGSFAYAADQFLGRTKELLAIYLERRRVGVDLLPKILVSKLHNQAGLIGGAYIALHGK